MNRRLATVLPPKLAPKPATDLEKLALLRSQIYGIPQEALNKSSHSVFQALTRDYRAPRTASYWGVSEIWHWPRAADQPWTDLKKQSIRQKLQALFKRGKGPLAKAKDKSAASKSSSKRK